MTLLLDSSVLRTIDIIWMAYINNFDLQANTKLIASFKTLKDCWSLR